MHYKLLGFTQDGPVRRFTFHRIETGVAPVLFAVLADTALARRYNVRLQDLPSLCSIALGDAGADAPAATLSLTEEHINQCAMSKTAAAAQIAAAGQVRSRRASLANAGKTAREALPGEKSADVTMESLEQLKHRFVIAFRMYSCRDAALRSAATSSPEVAKSAAGQALSVERQKLSDAERDYRNVRLEYVNRLLSLRQTSERSIR